MCGKRSHIEERKTNISMKVWDRVYRILPRYCLNFPTKVTAI